LHSSRSPRRATTEADVGGNKGEGCGADRWDAHVKSDVAKRLRRSIRLQGYDYAQVGAYFVTICANNRECLFGNVVDGEMRLSEYGVVVGDTWNDLPNHYANIALDEFVVMPNHVHGIIIISVGAIHESPPQSATDVGAISVGAIHELPLQRPPTVRQPMDVAQRRRMTLPKIVGRFKMNTAKRINEMRRTSGVRRWQRNYYEHIIRNDESMHRIREYIANNPLQWEFDRENSSGVGLKPDIL